MEKYSLLSIAQTQQDVALEASAGRASITLTGGSLQSLRQTLLALNEGQTMEISHAPDDATLLVISGSLDVVTADDTLELAAADLLVLPHEPLVINSRADTTALLSVAMGAYPR